MGNIYFKSPDLLFFKHVHIDMGLGLSNELLIIIIAQEAAKL